MKLKNIAQSSLRVVSLVTLFALVSWATDKFQNEQRSKEEIKTHGLVSPHPDIVSLQGAFAEVADKVKPAVVNISAVHIKEAGPQQQQFYFGDPNELFRQFFGDERHPRRRHSKKRSYRTEGTGSGVIIDADGTILTNNHVVQDANQLIVTLLDGKEYKGKVIGTDQRSDLAVIKIKRRKDFPFVPLGDSEQTKIGNWVMAVGSPFGLEQTVTVGIISAVRQSLNIEGKNFRNLLQTDAAINRGNSGGPLVNMKGQVIGINTAIYAPTGVFSGIGFAIPANHAKPIVNQLIAKGYVERGWLGVEILPVDDVMARQFNLKKTYGTLINHVADDSPAAKAGLKRGDIILEFNKKKVTSVTKLQDLVAGTPPQKTVRVKIVRDGRTKVVNLTTGSLPTQRSARANNDSSDGRDLASDTAEWLGATLVENEKGVMVGHIPVDSEAADVGLLEGDVVLAINQTDINNLKDLTKIDTSLQEGLLVDVRRQGRPYYLSYKSPV